MRHDLINIAYLAASVLFIMGVKGLTHPRTAVRANLLSATGMLLAVIVTLLDQEILGFKFIIGGLAIGGAIGIVLALKIELTAMPQLVAIYNGFGGAASVLVAGAALVLRDEADPVLQGQIIGATVASGIIGGVTFSGSLIAFGKLQSLISQKAMKLTGHQMINLLLALITLALGAALLIKPELIWLYWALAGAATVLGVMTVLPVGGADMPVVIALLNSFSGLACSTTGFVLSNNVLIIAGSLVGASGLILTKLMCTAMNRSLFDVMTGGGVASGPVASADEIYAGKVKSTSADEVAMLFDTARRVVFVPGYGLAVAQAQHVVQQLAQLLEERGIEVEFAIHPVAGRMPGHMNVLLAEADVPYDKLKDMDEINPSFPQVDVAIVIGANDVVNPMARTDPQCPIAGMPILDVDKAGTVVVIKRSLGPGFAGIPNPLFAADNTLMFFGDGKKALQELIQAVRES